MKKYEFFNMMKGAYSGKIQLAQESKLQNLKEKEAGVNMVVDGLQNI